MKSNAFTLIELVIVIAILAILAAVIVIVINPAEYIKSARDSSRMSDLQNIHKSIGLYQADGGTTMGSANTVYVSIADSSATCANLGMPTLPSGWAYACSTSANLHKVDGTGWIPINFSSISFTTPLSSLPVDPINTTSTGNYYTYVTGGSWKLKAQFESSRNATMAVTDGGPSVNSYELGSNLTLGPILFPDNWIKVPGNSSFGTSDFWVMKYEAKCVDSTTNTPLTTPDTGYNTYSNSTTACTGTKYPASAIDGYPIANISHNTALTYCSNIGAHLLTNDEWMTIARNAEQVSSNFTSGALYSGHNDNVPAVALQANKDDAQGYSGTGNSSGNQRRTLALSNGSVIWDIPGNVWEHVQRSVNNVGDLTTTISLPACSDGVAGWGWCQYGNSTTPYVSSWTADVAQAKVGPSNTGWNSSQGMGQVYTYKNGTSQGTTLFIRGGNWADGSHAGAFTLYLNWGRGQYEQPCGVPLCSVAVT